MYKHRICDSHRIIYKKEVSIQCLSDGMTRDTTDLYEHHSNEHVYLCCNYHLGRMKRFPEHEMQLDKNDVTCAAVPQT